MSVVLARNLRKNLTDAEQKLWRFLRLRQMEGWKFRRQQPIGQYIVDFVCNEKKLIIEIDGGQHTERQNYDQKRTEWLESQGFKVLRFWNNQVLQETDAVREMIWNELENTPHLNPPPQGGRKQTNRRREIP
ncbi:MAG: endonuclease domain-containing protein [Elusimicrobia bacterium]|nr:endonuclease domain-containing protein [Elusimicrobiota bacterium]